MTPDEAQEGITPSFGHIHLTPDELAQLSPDELLGACLEYRSLLQVIVGILTAAQETLTLRIVAADLVYHQAQHTGTGEGGGQAEPVVSPVKQVCERLGLRPKAVQLAYQRLSERGGVEILKREFGRAPRPRGQS
jgi:hypothetical protein